MNKDAESAGLTPEKIAGYREEFAKDPAHRLALNAVTRNPVGEVALSREAVARASHVYSERIKTPEATSQNKSGRCWLFAGLNFLRLRAAERMNLEKFELNLKVPDEEIERRLADWTPPEPRYTRGVLAKYAKLVQPASTGAVTS